MTTTEHPEPTHVAGLALDIAECEWQLAGCNGAGGFTILTSEVCKRACSRCAELEQLCNPDECLVCPVVVRRRGHHHHRRLGPLALPGPPRSGGGPAVAAPARPRALSAAPPSRRPRVLPLPRLRPPAPGRLSACPLLL